MSQMRHGPGAGKYQFRFLTSYDWQPETPRNHGGLMVAAMAAAMMMFMR